MRNKLIRQMSSRNSNGMAVTYEDTGEVFHDTDFHTYLRSLGINDQPGTEWFELIPSTLKQNIQEFVRIMDSMPLLSDYELRER